MLRPFRTAFIHRAGRLLSLALRKHRILCSTMLALGVLGVAAPAHAADVTITYKALNRDYEQPRFAGPALLWGADTVYTFPGQGANEHCNFIFWTIGGAVSQDPTQSFSADGTIDAVAWYFCYTTGGDGPGGPSPILINAIDLETNTIISDGSNIHLDSTEPAQFQSDCHATPCSFAKTKQGVELQSITGESILTHGGTTLQFKNWLLDNTSHPDSVRTVSVSASGFTLAIAFYVAATPAPPVGGVIPRDDLVGRDIPAICLYVYGGLDQCPGCMDSRSYCWFQFENVYDELMFVDVVSGDTIAYSSEIAKGVQALKLTPEIVRKVGGMSNIGLRLSPNARASADERRQVIRFTMVPRRL